MQSSVRDRFAFSDEDRAAVAPDSVFLNQSRINDFLRCEELYHSSYEFEGGLRPKEVILRLETGHAYHDAIAHYYSHDRDVAGAIDVALAWHRKRRAEARLLAGEEELWDNDEAILRLLVAAYHSKYQREPLQVLMPEAIGCVRLGKSPHFLVFRTDALFREYGTVGLLEYKTKNRTPGGPEVIRIHTDLQPTAYCYGVNRITGLTVEDVRYRWAIKSAKKTVNEIQLEERTHRTARDLARFEDEAVWVAERILENRKSGRWLHNWNQCTVFGECDMRRLCLHHREREVVELYGRRERDYTEDAKEVALGASNPTGV